MKLLNRTSATTQVAPVYHALTSYPAHNRIISGTPMNPPRRCRCLPAILAALALQCLASASAIAQTPPATLKFGTVSGIALNFIFPVTSGGKTYYYLDRDDSGGFHGGNLVFTTPYDGVTVSQLKSLLTDGSNIDDTQTEGHNGRDDNRSVIVRSLIGEEVIGDEYTLILPTIPELEVLRNDQMSNEDPNWSNWTGGGACI